VEHAWPAPRWASLCGELYRAAKDSIAARYEYAPYDLGLRVAVADFDYLKQGHVSYLLFVRPTTFPGSERPRETS
jgi:hypothetical protein